ncbi:MAG: hypothetical protein LVO36_03735 [Nitrosopumilus sp. (ex Thoosa mismalolli)]|nr:hypothetical protein [Nitrosopumilus sp. (ex Thoosa mismalolli)]
MHIQRTAKYNWDQIVQHVLTLPKHTDVIIETWMGPNIPSNFTPRMADNDNQLADYGLALDDDSGIHIKVYDGYYKIHWDEKDPKVDPIGHLVKDAPHWIVIGLIVALSFAGVLAMVRSR